LEYDRCNHFGMSNRKRYNQQGRLFFHEKTSKINNQLNNDEENLMPQIKFNGKTYNDLAEMPASERQAYEQLMGQFNDENQDGIPDIFQGDVVSNIIEAIASTNVVVDGKRVGGFKNLTQEQRINLEKGMGILQKMGIISEIPNLDGIHPSHPEAMPVWDDTEIRPSKPLFEQASAIQEDRGGSRMAIILVALVSLLICGAGVFFYFSFG